MGSKATDNWFPMWWSCTDENTEEDYLPEAQQKCNLCHQAPHILEPLNISSETFIPAGFLTQHFKGVVLLNFPS